MRQISIWHQEKQVAWKNRNPVNGSNPQKFRIYLA